MTHSTQGPSTPRDEAEPEQGASPTTGRGDSVAPGRAGFPVPPQPVFQRPPGYDTLSPASPYTVVFEPWPDTPSTGSNAVRTGAPVPFAERGAVPAAPSLAPFEAGQSPWAEPVAEPAETSMAAGEPAEPQPSPSVPASAEDDLEPPLARPYAASFAPAQPRPPEPGPVDQAPTDTPDPYAAATQPYVPASQPYVAAVQPAGPSFVPTSAYGGVASPQPFLASANGEPDPYFAFLRPNSAPPQFGSARPRTENVGRGLAAALLAVLGGCVLSAFVYHLGFVASIVALAMGAAGIFLYAKGAGAPPRKGALALVVLLIAGILLAWVSSVGTEVYFYYVHRTGTSNGALMFALESVLSLDLFKAMLKDFLIFVAFGLLGIFGVARRLLARRVR